MSDTLHGIVFFSPEPKLCVGAGAHTIRSNNAVRRGQPLGLNFAHVLEVCYWTRSELFLER